jgi:soluble lytic murein transglycosylase
MGLVPVLTIAIVLLAGAPVPTADPVAEAERALADGRPWRATRTLAPLLATPWTRTPEVVLLAARAAAGWEGWATVHGLLEGQPWLDRDAGGLGRALLARAALERGQPDAVAHAARAVALAAPGPERGRRLVLLARALDRQQQADSAAATWLRAAGDLPAVADWLYLRGAGVTADSATRERHYARVTLAAARPRVPWTEARARERAGDPAGAARIFSELGATLPALRLRLAAAATPADRQAVRSDLVRAIATIPAADLAPAIELLDRFRPLTASEDLTVARRAAAAGLLDRANRGFLRAAEAGLLSDDDRFTWGTVYARLGRHREAIVQFERVRGARLAEAQYQRARSLFRVGPAARGRAALRAVRDSFPADPVTAATAGWLLADLLVDEGNDAAARREFLEVAGRYPETAHGERAAFQAALLAFIARDHATAAREFDVLADREPGGGERTAALYWSGRAREALGDQAGARERYRALIERFPQSYYVVPASRRLGSSPWPGVASTAGPEGALPPAFARAALLDSLGLGFEAGLELDHVAREAERTPESLAHTARLFHRAGHASRALRLAQRAVEQGIALPTVLELLYPLVTRDVLEDEARAEGLSPFLVAGLIRQESAFDPRARSRADARGLMQILPATGAQLARAEQLPEWDPVLLYQADVNLHFGLRYLARALERCGGSLVAALAAYNAGPTPVNRWLTRPGTADPEVFIERIPFVETRDYVRRVLYNEARYAAIHGG